MTFTAFSGWKPCFSVDHKQFLADHWSVIGCYFKPCIKRSKFVYFIIFMVRCSAWKKKARESWFENENNFGFIILYCTFTVITFLIFHFVQIILLKVFLCGFVCDVYHRKWSIFKWHLHLRSSLTTFLKHFLPGKTAKQLLKDFMHTSFWYWKSITFV